MKLIFADKYKELLYAAAELGQYKIMNEKLKDSLQSKSAEIKKLRRIICNYENSNTNKIQVENIDATNTENEPKILETKVNNLIETNRNYSTIYIFIDIKDQNYYNSMFDSFYSVLF